MRFFPLDSPSLCLFRFPAVCVYFVISYCVFFFTFRSMCLFCPPAVCVYFVFHECVFISSTPKVCLYRLPQGVFISTSAHCVFISSSSQKLLTHPDHLSSPPFLEASMCRIRINTCVTQIYVYNLKHILINNISFISKSLVVFV